MQLKGFAVLEVFGVFVAEEASDTGGYFEAVGDLIGEACEADS